MDVTLLTAVDAPWESGVVATLSRTGGTHLVRRCADLPDLVAAAAAGLARVAVVGADLRGLDRDALAHLRDAGVAVVGVHAPGDEQGETFLRRIGVEQVLPTDADQDAWLACLTQAVAQAEVPPAPGEPPADPDVDPAADAHGEVVAVWGPTGAPGRSFVALGMAAALAEAGCSVLVVDADTYGASLAQALALLDEAAGLAAAVRAANLGRLDAPALAALAPEVRPRLRVLTGLPEAERWPELVPDAVLATLASARELSQVVVVDCAFCLEEDEDLSYDTRAPRRNGVTTAVLEDAEHVVAVGRADPVGLTRLVRGLGELRGRGIEAHVVANRVRSAAVGPQPDTRVREALERFAGAGEVHCLPEAADVVDPALLEGRLLVESAPRAAVTTALDALARALPLRHRPAPATPRRRLLR